MAKFFGNLHYVLVAGLLLAIAVIALHGGDGGFAVPTLFRWIHTFVGIVWIGLLYYFNFVQIPTMPKVPAELKPGISKHIAPSALFFFRWAAALTVVFGLAIAGQPGPGASPYLVEALTFQPGYDLIGIGMWLAIIMFINVWFVIWPNQKKALGIGAENASLEAAVKAKAARTAMLFSRTNTFLSAPMLVAMTGAQAFA